VNRVGNPSLPRGVRMRVCGTNAPARWQATTYKRL
jgi:hypothetical protein